ncbi:haloacid dehalogenase-like hydrolase [Nostoc sp. DedQUE09]|uniref:haloacid dehalogenase-like hydrolase n=1 Tax=Nostoc sp. DedQUE09 TaxID=3075394 RepID=UPI002AD3F3DC|nr:haloacid dehalogenase-like hydrolase [Nostoc sp. DedQUE09]MDZ7952993.1 haloacid dehalogenase-like hydrolase [Nostoc sp. DedQUE09]
MSLMINALSHETSVPDVIDVIETAPSSTPILVDLDETIFLRNSTQEYLNTLQPRPLGWLLLTLLNFLKPWNWLPGEIKGEVSRDWMRVLVATLLFPWTVILWQWRAKQLAQAYGNTTLVEALTKNPDSRVILTTQGFDFIVRSLSKHLPVTFHDVIACRFWQGAIDRQRGKHFLVTASLGENEVTRAIAITDSKDDNPLLACVATPCLVIWPEANYVSAMSDLYIPFLYLERAKRPGKKYFLKAILLDDLVVLIIALSWVNSQPILHAISMLFLVLSFWCIYELGYVENDIIAERFEKNPTLSETYQKYKNRISVWQAWLWSVIFAVPGLIVLELTKVVSSDKSFAFELSAIDLVTVLTKMAFWIGILLVVRATFYVYNHVDKQTRIWLYFLLQAYKYFGFLVVTKTNIIGTILFIAEVISRWIRYFVYRLVNSEWLKDLPHKMVTLVLFGFIVIAVVLGTQNSSILMNWQTLVILIFCAYRARYQFWKIVSEIYLISKEKTRV